MKNFISSILLSIAFSSTVFAQIAAQPNDVHPLFVGDTIPNTMLLTTDSSEVGSNKIILKPTVLIVYRGGWCPYCNAHLSAVGMSMDKIDSLGYEVIGVSPDAPSMLHHTVDKNELTYSLYSDYTGLFTQKLGVAYQSPDKYDKLLTKASSGNNSGWLPVPSVFVLDENGVIQFEYIVPNYKIRMTSELLVNVLSALNK